MKKSLLVTTLSLALVTGAAYASLFKPSIKTDSDKISYSLGYEIGNSFKTQQVSINQNVFEEGLTDGLKGNTPAMTQDEMKQTMMAFQKQMMQKAMQQQQALAAKNATASAAYIKQVSSQPGVMQLTDDLYYKVITPGKGKMPKATDTVTVNYEGTLPNGTVFDSSYQRGKPATFQVNQVIPGWSKVLQKMPVGSTWMVYMAPSQGYGMYAPPQIGPNQALTFKIQLLSIGAASTTMQPAATTQSAQK